MKDPGIVRTQITDHQGDRETGDPQGKVVSRADAAALVTDRTGDHETRVALAALTGRQANLAGEFI